MFVAVAVLSLLVALGVRGETKVNATFYWESLCPYCTFFLQQEFAPYWLPLQYYINLKLVPSGNTYYVNGTLHCQHGPRECLMNKMMACVMKYFQDLNQVVPFVMCLQGGTPEMMEFCASPLPFDPVQLRTCAEGNEGDHLLQAMHTETMKVRSKDFGVPAVAFNGDLQVGDDVRFGDEVCKRLSDDTQQARCKWFVLQRSGQQTTSAMFAVTAAITVAGMTFAFYLR